VLDIEPQPLQRWERIPEQPRFMPRSFSCRVEPLERRLLLSAPAVPNPFLFLSGYSDGGKSDFQQVLPYYTAVGGITSDAGFVQGLRDQGKLFLYQTIATPSKTVAQLVADWSVPFQNTLGGALPGGFDAIQIDEFGAYPDGSAEATKYATALQQLRASYPDKRIFVWSTWNVADGGPNTLYGNPANTYATLLNAINNYADRYMLEVYLNEANPQLYLFNPFADNIESFAPGLRAKTVFGLYIPQSGFVADDSANIGYWGYLDAQFNTIRNDPQMSTMPGVALWIAYRAEKMTWDYVGRLANHYFTQYRTSYFGDGSYAQAIGNPGFETNSIGWSFFVGTSGALARVSYANEGVTPTYHDDYGYATHGSFGLRMIRGAGGTNRAEYTAAVTPGMTYTVSAFVKAAGASSGANRAKLVVTTAAGTQIAAKEAQDAPLSVVGGPWKRILYNFTVPAGQTSVKVVLTDPSVPVGTTLYWDFIELEPAYVAGDGMPPTVSSATFNLAPSHALQLVFSEDIAPTFIKNDVQLVNLGTGVAVSAAIMNLSYAGGTAPATLTFPGLSGDALADGHYRLTLSPGCVADASGSVLMSPFTYEFFVATGSSASETYHLQRDAVGALLRVTKNGGIPLNVPLANLALVAISAGGGDDLLHLDLTNGLPWSAGGIVYDLGAHTVRDTLQLTATTSNDTITVQPTQVSIVSPVGAATLSLGAVESFILNAAGGEDTLNVDGGSVIFQASQQLAALNISAGAVTIAAAGNRVLRTRSLDVSADGATLDLNDNALIVDYDLASPIGSFNGSAYTGITGHTVSGRNGGSWNGDGIITSMTAAAAPQTLMTLGVADAAAALSLGATDTAVWQGNTVDSSAVLVRYTFTADATLDGGIDGDDYLQVDAGYSASATGYAHGDFDYNGVIDADDYFLIDSNYNKAQVSLAPAHPLGASAGVESYSGHNLFSGTSISSAYERLNESTGKYHACV
jgi:hypothetical protein